VLESYFGTFTMSSRYKKGKLNLNADENSLTSANMFIKKSAFKRIGGFDDRLFPGEDPEFFARAKNKGIKTAYSPELIIYHRRRNSLGGFCRQFFSYGKVRLSKERISRGRRSFVFFFPALFSLYAILSPFLSLISKYFFAPLAAYFAIAILFSIPKIAKNLAYPLLLPFLYFLIHFSYGLGMIYSLLKR
jgi:GT2 family glycosyltransferase